MVQWLGLHTFTANDVGSTPSWGTKLPQAVQHAKKKKKERKREERKGELTLDLKINCT